MEEDQDKLLVPEVQGKHASDEAEDSLNLQLVNSYFIACYYDKGCGRKSVYFLLKMFQVYIDS